MNDAQQTRRGVLLALGAYTMWGVAPIYFKSLTDVPPLEVLMHRVLWSFFFLAVIVYMSSGMARVRLLFKDKKRMALLAITAIVIASNWLIFIWAVGSNRMLDASLGYYINPLLNVVLGMVFLGERFRKLQWLAVALATAGVGIQLVTFGSLPWVALVLASSFGVYGLLRKKINVDAATGLFIETLVLLPASIIYLFFIAESTTSNLLDNSIGMNLLLIAAGVVTTLPLLCFNGAATKLRLSTLGFFQYIGPSIMFLLAIGLYNEPFTADKATTFIFIWTALVVFTFDAVKQQRKQRREKKAQP